MPKSDHPWWRKFFSKSWSRTLRQSVDNPLQTERLPADAAPEFDYPVQSESRAASRYITFKACLFTLLPTAVFAVLVRCMTFLATDLLVLSFVSSVAYLAYHLAPPEPLLRKLAFAMAGMLLSFLLLTLLPLTMACCSVATIGILILADRFATHCISLATAAPTARATAFEIRRLWCDRFATLQRPLRGAELYPFGFITVLLLVSFWIQYFQAVDRPRDPHNLLQAFLWPSALTIGGTLLVEIGVAFLYQRRPTSFLQMIPALWCALVDWHCYNSRESSALGIHRTPAGSNAARRRLLLGVFFLWFLVFTSIHAQFPQRHQNEADVADAPTPLQLTPVEQHYVDHLSESDAEAYRRDRAAAIAIPRPRLQPAATSGAYSPFTSTDGSDAAATIFAPWYTQLLNVAYQFFLVIYFFLKLGLLAAAFTATAIFAATARVVTIWNRGSSDSRVFNTANWDHLVARIQNSSDPTEQNSLILGVNAADDSPVLVPRDVFREHAHILGDSGSGKTSLGIMPLMMQLLRQGTCSVIVIDLKADDQVLFETISREAAAVGRRFQSLEPEHPGFPFRWFTTEVGRATYAFNPLRQSFLQNLRDDQRTDLLTAALGLQYGTDYGRKFFGDANFELLHFAVKNNPDADSFTALADVLAGSARFPIDAETKRAATNVKSSVRRLAGCRPLNASPANGTPRSVLDAAIDLDQVFTTPQALYFALPSATGTGISAEIARLILHSLLSAAQMHKGPRRQTFVFIDEFQRIVANNLELLLQTARSLNIGLILSNQSTSDLEAGDANLLPAIRANTRWRQNFSVSNIREIEELRDASGETIVNPAVMSFVPALLTGYFPGGITFSETRTARMGINDILLAGDAPGRSIATLRRSAGFAQFGGFPFIMDSVYPISLSEFQARLRAPWPAPSAETLVATLKDVSPGAQSRSRVLPPATHPVPIDDPGRDEPEADEFPPDMGIENERPAVPDDVQCKSSNSVDHAAEEIEEISFEHFPEAAQESPEPSTPPETPEQVADSFQFLDSLMLEQMERDERRRRIKKKAAKKERDRTTDQNTLPGMM